MTSLYRCRGSAEEIRDIFGCRVERGFTWSPLVRPNGHGVIITAEQPGLHPERLAQRVRWGCRGLPDARRQEIWADFNPFGDHLFADGPESRQRCLIVLDSFAFPDGPKGQRTRSWFGLWDEPMFAWAGVCGEIDSLGTAFVGALTQANSLVKRVSSFMPTILAPEDHEAWLSGNERQAALRARTAFDPEAMWLEQSDELWTSGVSIDELEAHNQTRRSPPR
jgi:putative SOS response-associated peptidase YedK